MKEETIIQILNSLTTVGEKSLDDLIEYYGHIKYRYGVLFHYWRQ